MTHLTIRFDIREAKLVSDALQMLAEDANVPPADKICAARMRDLIDRELGREDDQR